MSLANVESLKCMFSHKSDDWATPSALYNRFMELGFFDPCPLNSNFDGLSISWKRFNFVNPPFSKIPLFIEKAVSEVDLGNHVVMLLPVRTDTKWFEYLVAHRGVHIVFIQRRLHFNDSKRCAPFPCMLVTFGSPTAYWFHHSYVLQSYDRLLDIDWRDFALGL